MLGELVADGSSLEDSHDTVRIDRSEPAERWRYTCPEGCADWIRTNNHIICRTCQEADKHDVKDVDVEYYYILDQQTGEKIPWSAVEVVE